ncbi:MAG: methylisocitrate lyase [Acidilobus sp.]|jgi:methylisocitrate lyase|uniref:methylisocitrate lyase n=1 Tax=Acidilobus sp. 7A TaxID=1577685 RepID=UPI000E3EBF3F|nr:methylisocitrate lyase [Acidilobus sp. 7A]
MAYYYRKRSDVHPALRLRELTKGPGITVVPGVFDPASALLAESVGFKAIYLSGAALTGSLAMPDLSIITFSEVLDATRRIMEVVDLPVIVDTDTGFGEAINVYRTVKELEEAGAAAVQIEDQVLPKKCGHLAGKHVVPPDEMIKKIIMATEARRHDIVIVARTDAREVEGLDAAVERAQMYVEAGADVIFPEALHDLDEFKEFARKVKAPLLANMTEFGKTPYITAKEFEEAGYRFVIFPVTTFRAAMKAMKDVLLELREKGTQKYVLDRLMSRQEFYDLIGYYEYEKRDSEVAEKAEALVSRLKEKSKSG